jgi:FkbM family methyltransferase
MVRCVLTAQTARESLIGCRHEDAPYFGHGLTIVDVGANVGAFSVWADLRWPRSTIHAYEPHPGTFEMLVRNVGHLSNVRCERVAVYPSERAIDPLISRYEGDGEAGLVHAMATTWRTLPVERMVEVPVLAPAKLPEADIVKVDAEGSEAAIVEGLDLQRTSLLLVEYQNLENLDRIMRATAGRFDTVRQSSHPWNPLLKDADYRRELRDDRYGTLIQARLRTPKLRRGGPGPPAWQPSLTDVGLRAALRSLPGLTAGALRTRLRGLARRRPLRQPDKAGT